MPTGHTDNTGILPLRYVTLGACRLQWREWLRR